MKGFISPTLHPFKSLLLFAVFVLAGLLIGNFLAVLLIKLIWGIGLMEIGEMLTKPVDYPESRSALVFFQGVVHLMGFSLAGLVFLRLNAHRPMAFLSPRASIPFYLLLATALLLLVIVPAGSWLVHWNANLDFPAFLDGFEQWAKAKEESLRQLTLELTKMKTVPHLLLGLFVFAVLPAIGEELVFRGVLQQELQRWWRNPHVAIWVAAFVFGAIHMQFYGLFPRMLLGVLFGYLYWWSGNLWIPIVGHFVNNGFMVVLMYLQQRGQVEIEVEATEALPWHLSLLSLVLSIGVLYGVYQVCRRLPAVPEADDDGSRF